MFSINVPSNMSRWNIAAKRYYYQQNWEKGDRILSSPDILEVMRIVEDTLLGTRLTVQVHQINETHTPATSCQQCPKPCEQDSTQLRK